MRAEIFTETAREHRMSIVWWSVGIAAFIALQIVFYPSVKDASALNDYAKDLSDAMRALFVGGETDLTSGVGYLNSQIFAFAGPLLLLIFAVGAGGSLIAGDEENGGLDLTLAQPVSRTSVLRQRLAYLAAAVIVLSAVMLATVAVLSALVDLSVPAANLLAATVSCALLALTFGSLALAMGAIMPGRARAIAVAGVAATASWVLDGLGQAVGALEPWRPISPFYQALGASPLRDGADWGGWAILIALIAIFGIAGALGLRRRDIDQ